MEDPAADIEGVVTALLRGDTRARQHAIKQFFTEDALFVHPLLSLKGRHEIYDLYNYWYHANSGIQFTVNRAVLSPQKDMLIVDLDEFICPRPFASLVGWKPVIRLIIFLHLSKTAGGWKIRCQEDHILWAESALKSIPPVDRLWRIYLRRCVGLWIVWLTRIFGMVYRFIRSKVFDLPNEYNAKLFEKWDASLGQKDGKIFFETPR